MSSFVRPCSSLHFDGLELTNVPPTFYPHERAHPRSQLFQGHHQLSILLVEISMRESHAPEDALLMVLNEKEPGRVDAESGSQVGEGEVNEDLEKSFRRQRWKRRYRSERGGHLCCSGCW